VSVAVANVCSMLHKLQEIVLVKASNKKMTWTVTVIRNSDFSMPCISSDVSDLYKQCLTCIVPATKTSPLLKYTNTYDLEKSFSLNMSVKVWPTYAFLFICKYILPNTCYILKGMGFRKLSNKHNKVIKVITEGHSRSLITAPFDRPLMTSY